MTHMKTTIDLPDDLLTQAKVMAARRRTTLRDLVMRGLQREIGADEAADGFQQDTRYELSELGLPRLRRHAVSVTDQAIAQLAERIDAEEFQAAVAMTRARR